MEQRDAPGDGSGITARGGLVILVVFGLAAAAALGVLYFAASAEPPAQPAPPGAAIFGPPLDAGSGD